MSVMRVMKFVFIIFNLATMFDFFCLFRFVRLLCASGANGGKPRNKREINKDCSNSKNKNFFKNTIKILQFSKEQVLMELNHSLFFFKYT